MQLNNPKSNTSNLIKQSKSARKKARRRLIGSIFMLFTALIILLNVTTKVKPIPVNPKTIEISNTASAAIKASAPVKQIAAASVPVNASDHTANASSPTVIAASDSSAPHNNGFRAGVISRGEQAANSGNWQQASSDKPTVAIAPKVIAQVNTSKPSPQEILNGNMTSISKTIYFIQIADSQNKSGLQTIQNNLANHGIKSFVQNTKNNMYRLRVGPFKNKTTADEQLTQIQNNLD